MADKKNPDVQKVIDALNTARGMELQAISQYMVQHYTLDEMDYGKLCAYQKLIAIDEMRHAEKFAERVKELGGAPNCEKAGPIEQPQELKQIYPFDIGMESDTIEVYDKFAKLCHECGDATTASIFEDVIREEEIHLGYYQQTANHIDKLGDAFLAKYAATSKHSGPVKSFVNVMEKEDF